MAISIAIAFLIRLSLVALFLPFSALEKLADFGDAVHQAQQIGCSRSYGRAMVLGGLFIEVVMSLGVLTGVADRMAALILGVYCLATALCYKRFWAAGDLSLHGPSHGRDLFWDFWKNTAVAGGFLLITFGTQAHTVDAFFAAPFSSTHPYSQSEADR